MITLCEWDKDLGWRVQGRQMGSFGQKGLMKIKVWESGKITGL